MKNQETEDSYARRANVGSGNKRARSEESNTLRGFNRLPDARAKCVPVSNTRSAFDDLPVVLDKNLTRLNGCSCQIVRIRHYIVRNVMVTLYG